jgi:methylmalonyl-CoA epimerase
MILKIDHIGIFVNDLEASIKFYQEIFGLKVSEIEHLEHSNLQVAFLPIGDTDVELLQDTAPDAFGANLAKSEESRIHHIAFMVDDIEKTLIDLKFKKIELIDEVPRFGARGTRIAFLHPNSSNNILIELCERK